MVPSVSTCYLRSAAKFRIHVFLCGGKKHVSEPSGLRFSRTDNVNTDGVVVESLLELEVVMETSLQRLRWRFPSHFLLSN